jgi:hypothetical protein
MTMADSIYRATVFYTGKYAKSTKMGGNMFMRAPSKEIAEAKMRSAMNEQLVAGGFPRDIFTLEVCVVSYEEVENYFRSKQRSGGGTLN